MLVFGVSQVVPSILVSPVDWLVIPCPQLHFHEGLLEVHRQPESLIPILFLLVNPLNALEEVGVLVVFIPSLFTICLETVALVQNSLGAFVILHLDPQKTLETDVVAQKRL